MISARNRYLSLVTAVVAFVTGLAILTSAGLPERGQFTGQLLVDGSVSAPELNAIAPNFSLTTLEGTTITLDSLRGGTVLINFWATWCEPCRVEMPYLQAFYEANQARGLRVLAVNLGETPDIIRTWVDDFGLTFDILLDPQQSLAALYQIRGQPSTFAISSSGIINAIYYGPVSVEQLQAVLP